MAKYTSLLSNLSSKDYQSDVDKASQDLAGSLKNLGSSSTNSTEAGKVSGIIGTLVDAIGKQVIEHKRVTKLRTAMDMAQEGITNLSNLIVESNKEIKDFVGLMQKSIIDHANASRPAYASVNRFYFDSNVAVILAEIADNRDVG
ncbi:MAG TPA: hypothetical protein VLX29_09910 [Nitrospirota bacterium]|nr:hypothetical protein [Nitrospirota bacterium]